MGINQVSNNNPRWTSRGVTQNRGSGGSQVGNAPFLVRGTTMLPPVTCVTTSQPLTTKNEIAIISNGVCGPIDSQVTIEKQVKQFQTIAKLNDMIGSKDATHQNKAIEAEAIKLHGENWSRTSVSGPSTERDNDLHNKFDDDDPKRIEEQVIACLKSAPSAKSNVSHQDINPNNILVKTEAGASAFTNMMGNFVLKGYVSNAMAELEWIGSQFLIITDERTPGMHMGSAALSKEARDCHTGYEQHPYCLVMPRLQATTIDNILEDDDLRASFVANIKAHVKELSRIAFKDIVCSNNDRIIRLYSSDPNPPHLPPKKDSAAMNGGNVMFQTVNGVVEPHTAIAIDNMTNTINNLDTEEGSKAELTAFKFYMEDIHSSIEKGYKLDNGTTQPDHHLVSCIMESLRDGLSVAYRGVTLDLGDYRGTLSEVGGDDSFFAYTPVDSTDVFSVPEDLLVPFKDAIVQVDLREPGDRSLGNAFPNVIVTVLDGKINAIQGNVDVAEEGLALGDHRGVLSEDTVNDEYLSYTPAESGESYQIFKKALVAFKDAIGRVDLNVPRTRVPLSEAFPFVTIDIKDGTITAIRQESRSLLKEIHDEELGQLIIDGFKEGWDQVVKHMVALDAFLAFQSEFTDMSSAYRVSTQKKLQRLKEMTAKDNDRKRDPLVTKRQGSSVKTPGSIMGNPQEMSQNASSRRRAVRTKIVCRNQTSNKPCRRK